MCVCGSGKKAHIRKSDAERNQWELHLNSQYGREVSVIILLPCFHSVNKTKSVCSNTNKPPATSTNMSRWVQYYPAANIWRCNIKYLASINHNHSRCLSIMTIPCFTSAFQRVYLWKWQMVKSVTGTLPKWENQKHIWSGNISIKSFFFCART